MEGLAKEGLAVSNKQKLSCEEKAIKVDYGSGT